jgi:hypothetical protein
VILVFPRAFLDVAGVFTRANLCLARACSLRLPLRDTVCFWSDRGFRGMWRARGGSRGVSGGFAPFWPRAPLRTTPKARDTYSESARRATPATSRCAQSVLQIWIMGAEVGHCWQRAALHRASWLVQAAMRGGRRTPRAGGWPRWPAKGCGFELPSTAAMVETGRLSKGRRGACRNQASTGRPEQCQQGACHGRR